MNVYVVIKRYEANGKEFADWHYKPYDHDKIYDCMLDLTGDHNISSDAAEWCKLAGSGEIYEFGEGEIEIQEID